MEFLATPAAAGPLASSAAPPEAPRGRGPWSHLVMSLPFNSHCFRDKLRTHTHRTLCRGLLCPGQVANELPGDAVCSLCGGPPFGGFQRGCTSSSSLPRKDQSLENHQLRTRRLREGQRLLPGHIARWQQRDVGHCFLWKVLQPG